MSARTVLARNQSCDVFVEVLSQVRDRYHFRLVGYVVMPEHVHLLIGEPGTGTPSTVVQMLKQRVSRTIRVRDADEKPHPHKPRAGHPKIQIRYVSEPGPPARRFARRRAGSPSS